MINILTNLMVEAGYSENIDQALPILKQLQLIDDDFVPNPDDDYSENLQEIVNKLHESTNSSIFSFDAECIENSEDYAYLTKELFACADMPSAITKIKSDYNYDQEKAGLAMRIGETSFKKIWSQTSDYVASEYLSFIDEVLEQQFDKKLLTLPTQDQCCHLLVVSKEQYEPLNSFFTRAEKGLDADSVYQNRFWVTVLVTIVGFIVTPFLGWYFFGFWNSVLYSLIFWLVFCCYNLYKAVSTVAEEERMEKLQQEDPVLFAQSIMTAFVDEAAKREKNSPMGKRLKAVAEVRKKELEEKLNSKISDPV